MTPLARPRRIVTCIAALATGLAACSGGAGATGVEEAQTCEALAAEAGDLVADIVAEVDELSLADLAASDDEGAALLAPFEERGEAIDAAQAELGCSDEEMTALVDAELDRIEVEPGSMGAIVVEAIRTDGLRVTRG